MTDYSQIDVKVKASKIASQAMVQKSNLSEKHKEIAGKLINNFISEHEDIYGLDNMGLLDDKQVYKLNKVLSENAQNNELLKESFGGSEMISEAPTNVATGISLFRKKLTNVLMDAVPAMIGPEVCGIHVLKSRSGTIPYTRYLYTSQNDLYTNTAGNDIYRRAGGPNTAFTGTGTDTGGGLSSLPIENLPSPDTGLNETDTTPADDIRDGYTVGTPISFATGEDLGDGTAYDQVAMTIGNMLVSAKDRGLKAEWSMEADLVARTEYGVGFGEKLLEIAKELLVQTTNRQIIKDIDRSAKKAGVDIPNKYLSVGSGVQSVFNGTSLPVGTSVDVQGKAMALALAIEFESNSIGIDTRFSTATHAIVSPNVATFLSQAVNFRFSDPKGFSTYSGDATRGNLVVGYLKNIQIIIDPYASNDYVLLVAKKSDEQAGYFYCPYLPLWIQQGQDFSKGAKNVAFLKTIYDLAASPYAHSTFPLDHALNPLLTRSNRFARVFRVTNM